LGRGDAVTAIGVVLRSCGTDVGPKAKCCNQCAPPDYGIRHAGRCAGHRNRRRVVVSFMWGVPGLTSAVSGHTGRRILPLTSANVE
jgi:hypothetical protein